MRLCRLLEEDKEKDEAGVEAPTARIARPSPTDTAGRIQKERGEERVLASSYQGLGQVASSSSSSFSSSPHN